MKKKVFAKAIGIVMAMVCVFSTIGAAAVFSAAAADSQKMTTVTASSSNAEENTEPTTYLEPGIYPIDNDHYLLVNPDHTFVVVYNPPTEDNP